jgi:hypothetical protein
MKSPRERAEEKREEKLARIREQQQDGSLVIRRMTSEERALYPVRPPREKRSPRR